MSCPIDPAGLEKLKTFLNFVKIQPDILHTPQLAFFKEFIEAFGGKLPEPTKMSSADAKSEPQQDKPKETLDDPIETDPESDVELDMTGCVDPDKLDENQKMGDPLKEVLEDDEVKADEKRTEAVAQFSEGNYEKAIELYNEAIELNPSSALLFAKRGQAYLKLTRPNACIKDCTRALELNPDSASAYKFRGRAYRLLGEWDLAARDLRQASNIDFDEQTDEWLREVTPNAKKIEDHLLKMERKRKEKEERDRLERIRKAREAHAAASAKQEHEEDEVPYGEGAPGGVPMGDFYKLLQDPEIMNAFQDPEVATAFEDISRNPANLSKYQSNPKIMALLSKLSGKFSGLGGGMNIPGFPGGAGGFPGFPGAGVFGGADEQAHPPPPQKQDEDNLD